MPHEDEMMVELNPQNVRGEVLKALGLPKDAQPAALNAIREKVEASPLAQDMREALEVCPTPEGFTPEAAVEHGELEPGAGVTPENAIPCEMVVKHVPTVFIDGCPCGAPQWTDHPAAVAAARKRGSELPPLQCSCGRWLKPYTKALEPRRKVEVVK